MSIEMSIAERTLASTECRLRGAEKLLDNCRENDVDEEFIISVEQLIEEAEFTLNAVEKHIPEKVTPVEIDRDFKIGRVIFRKGTILYKCKCGKYAISADAYCKHCGQALKWGDSND